MSEEIDVLVVEFDGKEYLLLDKDTINNKKYYYLVNEHNPKDFFFRSVNEETNTLDPLDDKEFDMVLEHFKNRLNNE